MTIAGIDQAAFYSSNYYIDLSLLAQHRGIDPDKFTIGLGQRQMAVSPPGEDIVTLAANAALPIINNQDIDGIDTLLFATESGIDQSKAAGIFVHNLLNLPRNCRVIELKQACYSATFGLQMACSLLRDDPTRKILLIASDIARYGLNSTGESSQGSGAVALLLTANPRMLAIEPEAGFVCEDAMDFWRPNYRDEALVDGKYSCDLYLKLLKEAWHDYSQRSRRSFKDHDQFLYHIPFPRLAEKAHQKLAMLTGQKRPSQQQIDELLGPSLQLGRTIGNCYTASMYLGLISLLTFSQDNLAGQRVGCYSYGSGATAEYFSGIIQSEYQSAMPQQLHQQQLTDRQALTVSEYESFYQFAYPTDNTELTIPQHNTGAFRLANIANHKRIYKAC